MFQDIKSKALVVHMINICENLTPQGVVLVKRINIRQNNKPVATRQESIYTRAAAQRHGGGGGGILPVIECPIWNVKT